VRGQRTWLADGDGSCEQDFIALDNIEALGTRAKFELHGRRVGWLSDGRVEGKGCFAASGRHGLAGAESEGDGDGGCGEKETCKLHR